MYTLCYDERVQKDLRRIPHSVVTRILKKVRQLEGNPRLSGVKKLQGYPGYRPRIGDYRVLFAINDSSKIVTVFRIRHRSEAYGFDLN